MTTHRDLVDTLLQGVKQARALGKDYRYLLKKLSDASEGTDRERPVDPPSDAPKRDDGKTDPEPLSYRHLVPPHTPDIPQAFRVIVGGGEDINAKLRKFYERNAVGPDDWVDVVVRGGSHGALNLGGKYKVHNEGRPLNLYVRTESLGSGLLDGLKIEGYGGTYVSNLVVQGLDIRKAKGEKAVFSDTAPSENVWLLDLRPLQNIEEALSGTNYMGGKWAYKPSDGIKSLVISGSRYGHDEALGRLTRWWEHPIYETGSRRIWIINNQLKGGNRTPIQCNTPRAGTWPQVSPELVVIRGNVCETGSQWGHDDGGSMIVWESDGLVLIEDNQVVSRYGGICIGHQPVDAQQYKQWPTPHNFQVSPEGHVHRRAVVRNNRITITEGGRAAVSINSSLSSTITGNTVQHEGTGPAYVIDGAFGFKNGAPKCTDVEIDAEPAAIWTWSQAAGRYVPYDTEQTA